MDFAIPAGARTAYISLLSWNNTGYFDVMVNSKGVWKFQRRIDQYQGVQNASTGGTHDGNIIVLAATGLDHFSEIRLQNRKGRIHFTGIGFSREDSVGAGGSGLVHWDNVHQKPAVAYTAKIAADKFNSTEVANLKAGKLDDGTKPWDIPAKTLTTTEVNNLKGGKLDDGTTPWTDGGKHNHTYNVNNEWLRENGDNTHVKLYGNIRAMVFRTDGQSGYGNNGAYPFIWLYGGDDATKNRKMILASNGNLWTATYGWLHDKFQAKGSYLSTTGGTITGALTVNGTLTAAGALAANKGISVDGKVVIDDGAGWHRTYGTTGWYNGTYEGGMYMTDKTWVRVYNNKALLVSNAIRAEDGSSQVDVTLGKSPGVEVRGKTSGSTPFIDFSNDNTIDYDARLILMGNDDLRLDGAQLGIKRTPSYDLDVEGTLRATNHGYMNANLTVSAILYANGESRLGNSYLDRTRASYWRRYNDSTNYTEYVHLDRLTVETSSTKYKYSVPVDHTRLKEYCADYDGCRIVIGMYNWDNGSGSGNYAFHSYRWFYNASNGRWRNMDSGPWGGANGRDKADGTQHSSSGWDACYFSDGVHVNGANVGDTVYGMNLLYWVGGGTGKRCRLTIMD